MKKIIILFTLTPLFFFNLDKNVQCLEKTGVWVGAETSIPSLLLHESHTYGKYKYIYNKTILNKSPTRIKPTSCRKVYNWYEDGLSLNFLTPETKDLVFKTKVNKKYWLDISKPQAQDYIINQIKINNASNNIHLDDHWAIPKQYGDYSEELDNLTKRLYTEIGPFSLSVLPLNYAKEHYNTNWLNWVNQGFISEIILQNYVENNFTYELNTFKSQLKPYKLKKAVAIYKRNKPLTEQIELIKKEDFEVRIFSLRTVFLDKIY